MRLDKRDLIFIQLVILATIFSWQGILNQMIEGEGFIYFSPGYSLFGASSTYRDHIFGFDNIAKVFTFFAERFVGSNMPFYMAAVLVTIVVVNVAFYLFVKGASKSHWIALIASLYSGVRFQSSYQLLARGHFQWFLQRIPEVPIVFLSFYFLYKFVKSKKTKYYYLAIVIFTTSILMTHYSSLFLPFFPAFLFITAITESETKRNFFKYLLLSIPFIFINYFFISNTSLSNEVIRPNQTYLQFLGQFKDTFAKISHQLAVVTVPMNGIQSFIQTINLERVFFQKNFPYIFQLIENFPKKQSEYAKVITKLIVPTYLFYFSTFYILYRKKSKALNLVLASFLALIGTLFLNVYLNRFNVYADLFQGRYYFVPTFYVGIIFASLLYSVIKSKKILFLIIIIYVSFNARLIRHAIKVSQYNPMGGKLMLKHIDRNNLTLPDNSIVFLPSPLMPLGEDFLTKFYSRPGIKYYFIDTNWQKKIPEGFDLNRVFVFDYNEEYRKGGNADVDRIRVVDESEEYRQSLTR